MILRKIFKFIRLVILAIVLFIIVSNVTIYVKSKKAIYKDIQHVPEAQTALILGAAVYSDGDLSPIFQSRVDTAVELYKAKKVSKILASGDNSTVSHNEVNPVRDYLLKEGIPDADIFLDHAGFDTYSTMYRARDIFQVSSVVVVTQSFHLPRSVFIARSLGIPAYGISADDGATPIKNYIREIFADEKAVMDLVLHRKPKFLGDMIPVTGVQQHYIITPNTPTPAPVSTKGGPTAEPSTPGLTMPPAPTPTPPKQGSCYIGGCSSQICSDQKDAMSTCEYTEAYGCYKKTSTCERQPSGQCGWTPTKALSACLNSAKSSDNLNSPQ